MRSSGSETRPDFILIGIILVLLGLGLVMVLSSTFVLGLPGVTVNFSYARTHLIRLAIGVLAFLFALRVKYTVWEKLAPLLLIAALGVLGVVMVLGHTAQGARRWLEFMNLTIQPAEFAKFALLVFLARFFSRRTEHRCSFKRYALPAVLWTGAVVALIAFQPNLGTAVALATGAVLVFFIAGVRIPHLAAILVPAALFLGGLALALPHARARVERFIHHDNYQVNQSLIAVGSGGVLGKGLGESKQKFRFLPQPHTDFIFSVFAEETGFIGTVVIFGLFLLLLARALAIARQAPDGFSFIYASGAALMIFIYFLIHTGVALGLVPTTGLPLPFISFGGSALISNLFLMGVVVNISRHRTERRLDEGFVAQRWNGRTYLPVDRARA